MHVARCARKTGAGGWKEGVQEQVRGKLPRPASASAPDKRGSPAPPSSISPTRHVSRRHWTLTMPPEVELGAQGPSPRVFPCIATHLAGRIGPGVGFLLAAALSLAPTFPKYRLLARHHHAASDSLSGRRPRRLTWLQSARSLNSLFLATLRPSTGFANLRQGQQQWACWTVDGYFHLASVGLPSMVDS